MEGIFCLYVKNKQRYECLNQLLEHCGWFIPFELEAVEIDSWREYHLIKINADADMEPIVLLKMICPSTGYTHVLRVPPNMESAREAITWVNWDIDPKDFAVES